MPKSKEEEKKRDKFMERVALLCCVLREDLSAPPMDPFVALRATLPF
jgi:hypothetical protein